jgi:hypothetical protein
VLHVSELEVFRLAYRNWFGRPANDGEIDSCFSHYIDDSEVPMWVRDFTRRVRKLNEEGRLDVRRFGVEPAPPTSHWMAFLGGMAFAGMLMVLILLVYLAIKAQETVPAGCQLPPCY